MIVLLVLLIIHILFLSGKIYKSVIDKERQGMVFSGKNEQANLVEIIELSKHNHFIACQFHPEFKSRPTKPHPLFDSLIKSSKTHAK